MNKFFHSWGQVLFAFNLAWLTTLTIVGFLLIRYQLQLLARLEGDLAYVKALIEFLPK